MRAKAFTLLELLIVMALSAVVITLAWALYANMNQFASQYRKRLADTTRMMELDQCLRFDAAHAENIQVADEQVCFESPNQPEMTCYEFETSFTIRHHLLNTDTIMLGIRSWEIDSLDGDKILHLDLADDLPDGQPRLNYIVHPPTKARIE